MAHVVTMPTGLFNIIYTDLFLAIIIFLFNSILSLEGSILVPSAVITFPFILIKPWVMYSSPFLLEQIPASERYFCILTSIKRK